MFREYDDDRKALIIISCMQSYNARKKAFESVENPRALYSDYSAADEIIEKCNKTNVGILTILDKEYPEKLKNIYDPPFVLYYKGNVNLLNRPRKLAVVGTRRMTVYGKNVLANFIPEFVESGLVIVSGLARGVDSVGHRMCLDLGGETIAVVANGLDICYPPENLSLENEIAQRGLVISEYPLGSKSLQYHFPERNRIISALSDGVFIPEAGENSGSLITADCAVEQGREVFVVPGSIFSQQSKGCNAKIKELQATCVLTPQDVTDALGVFAQSSDKKYIQLNIEQQSVMETLKDGCMHFYDIIAKTGMSMGQLPSVLTELEIMGLIRKIQGNFYEIVPTL